MKADVTQSCDGSQIFVLKLPGSRHSVPATVTVDQQLANQTSSPCIETEKSLSYCEHKTIFIQPVGCKISRSADMMKNVRIITYHYRI